MAKICSVEGCGQPHLARGFCPMHYGRWRRHRDVHFTLAGRGAVHKYLVDHMWDGCCYPWPYSKDEYGYGQLTVNGRGVRAYRYVCELVNGPPPTPRHEARHLCGNGHLACFHAGCLVWGSHQENVSDMVKHGTSCKGMRHGNCRLSETNVRQIRALRGNLAQEAIAKLFGVSKSTISAIQLRKRWSWLD